MKKIISLAFASALVVGIAFAADVIPNESAFPAAKPLINAKFTALDSTNTNQASSNATYAAASAKVNAGVSQVVTNISTLSTNIITYVSGIATNIVTVP